MSVCVVAGGLRDKMRLSRCPNRTKKGRRRFREKQSRKIDNRKGSDVPDSGASPAVRPASFAYHKKWDPPKVLALGFNKVNGH